MDKELNDQNFFRKNHPYDSFKCTYEPDPQHLMAVTPCKYCNLPGRQDKVTVDWYNAVRRSFKVDHGLASILAPLTREATELVSNEGRKYGITSNTTLAHVTLVDGLPSVSGDPQEHQTREEQIEGIRSACRSRPGLKVLGTDCRTSWSNESMLVVLKLQYESDDVVHAVQPLIDQARMPQWPFHCAVGIVEKSRADEAAANLAWGLQGTVLSLQAESIRELGAGQRLRRVDSDANKTQQQLQQQRTAAGRWAPPPHPETLFGKPENVATKDELGPDMGSTARSSHQETCPTTLSALIRCPDLEPPRPETPPPLVLRDGASKSLCPRRQAPVLAQQPWRAGPWFLPEPALTSNIDTSSSANGFNTQQQPQPERALTITSYLSVSCPDTLSSLRENGEAMATQFEPRSVSTTNSSQQQTRATCLSTDTGQPDAQPRLKTLPPLMMSSDEGERRSPWRQVAAMDHYIGRTDQMFLPEPELASTIDASSRAKQQPQPELPTKMRKSKHNKSVARRKARAAKRK
jgi:hypothetical protein